MRFLARKLIFISLLSIFTAASADDGKYNSNFETFPLWPRLSIEGLLGDNSGVQGDVMLPLVGNNYSLLYFDVQGKTIFQDDSSLASAGLGYRWLINESQLLGTYAFLDRNESDKNKVFWTLNPGVERLGLIWDFRANGYIPLGKKKHFVKTDKASNFGNYSDVTFVNHQQYSNFIDLYQTVSWGMDAEAGRVIPNIQNLKAYLGGYYFNTEQHNNMRGIAGRLEYALNSHVTITARDSYDNIQHNTFLIGLRYSFGGTTNATKTNRDISERLLDPISRNLATIDKGNGVAINNELVGPYAQLERNNIWFFNNNSSTLSASSNIDINSCTYEHPCSNSEFNQANVNLINTITPNTNFYLAPGVYDLNQQISINHGQSLFGRNSNYTQSAQENERPILIGSLNLSGYNAIDSLHLKNDKNHAQVNGINIRDASNIQISNSQIGELNASEGFQKGINLANANHIIVNNSMINAYASSSEAQSIKVDNSSLIINNNIINVISTYSSGLWLTHNGSIDANNNIFNVQGPIARGISMDASPSGIINLYNNTINVNTSNGVSTNSGTAIIAYSGVVNAQNNKFNVNVVGDAQSAIGAYALDTATINLIGNTFNIQAYGNNARATGLDSKSIINASNNEFTILASGTGSAVIGGLASSGGSTLTIKNNLFSLHAPSTNNITDTDVYGGAINSEGNRFIHVQ